MSSVKSIAKVTRNYYKRPRFEFLLYRPLRLIQVQKKTKILSSPSTLFKLGTQVVKNFMNIYS